MWLHQVSVDKNVHKYISPKLCLTPEIKSKYFSISECVGIGQTTVGFCFSIPSYLFVLHCVLRLINTQFRFRSKVKVKRYTFRGNNSFILHCSLPYKLRSPHKGKNLVPSEQILSFKNRPHFWKTSSSR